MPLAAFRASDARPQENTARDLPALYRCGRDFVAALAANKPYQTAAEILLGADRAFLSLLRVCGVEETFAAGRGSELEKFRAYCQTVGEMTGAALPRRCALLLSRVFDCDLPVDGAHADAIWRDTAACLAAKDLTPAALLRACRVSALLAPAEPSDDLADFRDRDGVRVLPLFSPAALFSAEPKTISRFVSALGAREGTEIADLNGLCAALTRSLDRFAARGCPAVVHLALPAAFARPNPYGADLILKKALAGEMLESREQALFAAQMWRFLCGEYARRRMVLELPLSADLGALSALLRYLYDSGCLPRTALYLGDPAAAPDAVALAGAYPAPKAGEPLFFFGVTAGSPTEMRARLAALANALPISRCVGAFPDLRLPTLPADPAFFGEVLRDLASEWAAHGEIKEEEIAPLAARVTWQNAAALFGICPPNG